MSRYDLEDPICVEEMHKRTGIVTAGDPDKGPHAATNVCDRQECIEDAKRWAYKQTHIEPTHRLDKDRK